MNIASRLLHAAETGQLRLRSIVLLNWHDGPLEGIAELAEPVSYWHFRVLGERTSRDDLDDRIYLFAQVAEPAVELLRTSTGPWGDKPLVWPFHDRPNDTEIQSTVDNAISSAEAPALLIQSSNFHDIKGIWRYTAMTD